MMCCWLWFLLIVLGSSLKEIQDEQTGVFTAQWTRPASVCGAGLTAAVEGGGAEGRPESAPASTRLALTWGKACLKWTLCFKTVLDLVNSLLFLLVVNMVAW